MDKENQLFIDNKNTILISNVIKIDSKEDLNSDQHSEQKSENKIKAKSGFIIAKIIHHYSFVIFYFISLFYFLFSNDIRLSFIDSCRFDFIFTLCDSLNALLFTLVSLYFLVSTRYLFTIFFISDILLIIVSILDIPQLRNTISSSDKTSHKWLSQAFFYLIGIVRLAVINKIIQFCYLRKYFRDFDNLIDFSIDKENYKNTSKLNKTVLQQNSELPIKTATINLILLGLIFVFILANSGLYSRTDNDFAIGLDFYKQLLDSNYSSGMDYIKNELPLIYSARNTPIINITIPSNVSIVFINQTNFRSEDLLTWNGNLTTSLEKSEQAQIFVSVREITRFTYILSIIRNLIIILIYVLFLIWNQHIFNKYIFDPYKKLNERMQIKTNLFSGKKKTLNTDCFVIESETNRIKKILLRGFGRAAEFVFSKIFSINNKFDFSLFKKTRSVYCIFGFCDIRRFTDVSEVLGKTVISFVNQIAEIVHSEVVSARGGLNKNVGDAFLVVWVLESDNSHVDLYTDPNISEDELIKLSNIESSSLKDLNKTENNDDVLEKADKFYRNKLNRQNSKLSELALISFGKIMLQLTINEEIQKVNNDPVIKSKLPDFVVKIGFGLHAGRAIEGGIGSFYKLDMAYIGQTVTIATQLEALTKEYKVSILFTQSLVNLIQSTRIKSLCREVKSIKLMPSDKIIRLYTIDTFPEAIKPQLNQQFIRQNFLPIEEIDNSWEIVFKNQHLVHFLKADFIQKKFEVHIKKWKNNKNAIMSYFNKNWEQTEAYLMSLDNLQPDQISLLNEIRDHKLKCPKSYETYRILEV